MICHICFDDDDGAEKQGKNGNKYKKKKYNNVLTITLCIGFSVFGNYYCDNHRSNFYPYKTITVSEFRRFGKIYCDENSTKMIG